MSQHASVFRLLGGHDLRRQVRHEVQDLLEIGLGQSVVFLGSSHRLLPPMAWTVSYIANMFSVGVTG